jgi:transposase InsO family protein
MGSQCCSNDYQQLLKRHDFICSMSRKGNCWDNAPTESFWGKLKQEWLNEKLLNLHYATFRFKNLRNTENSSIYTKIKDFSMF